MSENLDAPKEKTEEKKVNFEEIFKDYSSEQIKIQVAQNHLVGNFDASLHYKILDIVYPELVNIDKMIERKSVEQYVCYTIINGIRLNFLIKFVRLPNNQISATLVLQEKFIVGKVFETLLETPIKSISGHDDLNFLITLKKIFHLHTSDEIDEQSLFENYVSPPIELVTELKRKEDFCKALENLSEEDEKNYITDIINALKKSSAGVKVVKSFMQVVKNHNLQNEKKGKVKNFKEVLDKLLDEAIEEKTLPPEQLEEIAVVRKNFQGAVKSAISEYKKQEIEVVPTKKKEEKKEAKAEPAPSLPKEQPKEEKKSSPSQPSAPKEEKKSSSPEQKPSTKPQVTNHKISIEALMPSNKEKLKNKSPFYAEPNPNGENYKNELLNQRRAVELDMSILSGAQKTQVELSNHPRETELSL